MKIKKNYKIIISVALFVVLTAILVYGIIKGDFFTTLFNGRTL